LFLLATVFATLALGEHYLIDLVVAVPFTLVFQAGWTAVLPERQRARKKALWLGIILTVAWMLLLFFGLRILLASEIFSWGLVTLTVGSCMAFERKLAVSVETQ
jgi:hypothetical protein